MAKRQPALSKGERFEQLEKKVSSLEAAVRMSQMLLQQLGGSIQPLSRDFGELANRQLELQYRTLAGHHLSGLDLDTLNQKSLELRIKDFEEASAKEDAEKGYLPVDETTATSIVILTSVAAEADKSILRSKLAIAEVGFPELKANLIGKKVGDKVDADISGVKHTIEILAIRSTPEKLEVSIPEAK